MKAPHSTTSTLVVTSVGPNQIAEQRASVESWKAVTNTLISLNCLADRSYTNQVREFCQVVETDLTASEVVGKPLIRLDAFLALFRQSGADLLIITNSDIHLAEPALFVESLNRSDSNLLFGHRLDVEHLASPSGQLYTWGFDYFCIDRRAANTIPASMFAMGAPWWDFWLPMMAVLHGAHIARSTTPVARHVIHAQNWSISAHAWYALHFSEFVCEFVSTHLDAGQISTEQRAVLVDILVPYVRARRQRTLQLANGALKSTLQDELQQELYADFGKTIRLFIERQASDVE